MKAIDAMVRAMFGLGPDEIVTIHAETVTRAINARGDTVETGRNYYVTHPQGDMEIVSMWRKPRIQKR